MPEILNPRTNNQGAAAAANGPSFWTSVLYVVAGNPSIDYFVSAAVLEGQNRTALSQEDEPYSEQVSENKERKKREQKSTLPPSVRPSSF